MAVMKSKLPFFTDVCSDTCIGLYFDRFPASVLGKWDKQRSRLKKLLVQHTELMVQLMDWQRVISLFISLLSIFLSLIIR